MQEALAKSLPAPHNIHDRRFAALYELGGEITELFAKEVISQSGLPLSSQDPLVILDLACGTGAVSSVLHHTIGDDKKSKWQLTCGDMSDNMLHYTRQKMVQEEWHNVEVKIVNAQDTRLPSARYTHVFTAFECFRILQPGGILAVSTWKSTIWVCTLSAAITSLSGHLPAPSEKELYGVYNVGWDEESSVRTKFEEAGFIDIEVRTVKKDYLVPVDQFAQSCTILIPTIVSIFWTQDQRDLYESELPMAIHRYVEGIYGRDGMAAMEAEAIIATGRKP
ncbi:S-adenosyl-L-methionine-dependent methyltransferase [Aspergillus pseudotamarii]|uniref:S-adenosyl-L-methionine-dependent methyltransferase n=1 Tax=Aspergillus pseudotamarii TaxID=132259 RepID=A0A5N6S9U5_ASPPS|nr:S-adenosyl-L-methionine-dependent methyltransferase [Aspergillus pseudotamarii]KAE8131486.1 S-adenosyl-L-methionine-dependent methyltransferase [Aspergillus pseudotamarii]